MIVQSTNAGWEIILQPSHSLLAGQLAFYFDEFHRSEFWPITCAAISQHDNEAEELAGDGCDYVTDAGAPRDFTLVEMSSPERGRKMKSRIEHSYRTHRWMGLLISRHAEFLYRDAHAPPELAALLEHEKNHWCQVLSQIKRTIGDLDRAYELLRWCDRCSLILCQSQLPERQRRLEIITTNEETRYDIWQDELTNVRVDPWPFSSMEFHVGVEVYSLSQLSFPNDAALGKAIAECAPKHREFMFHCGRKTAK